MCHAVALLWLRVMCNAGTLMMLCLNTRDPDNEQELLISTTPLTAHVHAHVGKAES